jgi:hypothetical protein
LGFIGGSVNNTLWSAPEVVMMMMMMVMEVVMVMGVMLAMKTEVVMMVHSRTLFERE